MYPVPRDSVTASLPQVAEQARQMRGGRTEPKNLKLIDRINSDQHCQPRRKNLPKRTPACPANMSCLLPKGWMNRSSWVLSLLYFHPPYRLRVVFSLVSIHDGRAET